MFVRKRLTLVAAAALTCVGLVGAGTASAESPKKAPPAQPGVTVLATGLNGPRQLSATKKYVYVAESDAGQVSRVTKRTGAVRVSVTGANLAQGVVRTDGRFYIASGEEAPDEARTVNGSSEILVAKTGKKPRTFADLLAYELKRNPDNQTQFGPDGQPLDALSNPYYVVRSKFKGQYLLAADAGGNDVLAISKKGKVSTFFVPPAVTTGDCATTPQNSDAGPSCDPVPTGLAFGPDGNVYISTLSSLTPNEGRVYAVNKNGKLIRTWTGFTAPTGVAVGPDGSVYVSELFGGTGGEPTARAAAERSLSGAGRTTRAAKEAAPDPSGIGQIVKVSPNGNRTYAQVTLPAGLLYTDGKLYASAWSVAGGMPFEIPDAGQVVTVAPSAFVAR